MQIPFCGATYSGRSVNIDASRSVNLYPELTGAQDNKTQMVMVGTPGLSAFVMSIAGHTTDIRGIHSFNGLMYAVIYDKLYSIAADGTPTSRGTLSTNTGRVSIIDNGITANGAGGNQLIIVDGTAGYTWNPVTTTFASITDADFPGTPQQVEYIDGYFIVTNGSMSYFVSDLYNGNSWNALAFSPVSATQDNIVSVISHRQQLFFLKSLSTEVWYNAGTPTTSGSPFLRASGSVFDYGIAAKWSVTKGGNGFFFLCTTRNSDDSTTVGVAEVTEYQPTIISTPAINYKITSSTSITDCFGYCYSESGHIFYVLTNPTDNWTISYDTATKLWHERSSLANDFVSVNRHLGNCYANFNGKHYLGDYRGANVYEMSSAYYNDAGNKIWSFRTAQTISDPSEQDSIFIDKLIIDAETGVGNSSSTIDPVTPFPAGWSGTANVLILANGSITAGAILNSTVNPTASLSWSNDSGHTWSSSYPVSMGIENAFSTRMTWRRLGRARNRVFKIGINDSVKKIILGAFVRASK
jgi:hypothetical protein